MIILASALLVALGSIPLVRLMRARQLIKTRTARCEGCGGHEAVVAVHYLKNTGMLVLRQTSTLEATVCRGCALREGAKMTLHTAVLGWWGMISFVVTCVALPVNLLQMWWALGLRPAVAAAADSLDDHRDYALNLLATKDRETVVDVLARQTGATPQHVERYLDRIARAA